MGLGSSLGSQRLRRLGSAALLLAVVVLPAVPTLLRLHSALRDAPSLGDLATEEMGVLEAAQSVRFVGQWSRYGFFQPGPLFFYAMLPAYAVAHFRPWGLSLGMFLLCWSSALVICVLAWSQLERWSGACLAAPAVGATLLYLTTDGNSILFNYWTNFAVVLPFGAFLLLAAALAAGELWAMPIVVALLSFLVQTQTATLPATVAVTTAALAMLWRARRKTPRQPPLRGWLLGSIVVALAAWALPLYGEAVQRPGNLASILAFARASHGTHPWSDCFSNWAQLLAGPLTRLILGLSWQTALQGGQLLLAQALAVSLVALLVIGAALAHRRAHRASEALCVLCALAAASSLWAIAQIRGELLRYLTLWMAVLGALACVAILNETLARVVSRPRRAGRASGDRLWLLASLLVPGVALLVAAPEPRSPAHPSVTSLYRALEQTLARTTAPQEQVRLVSDDFTWPWTSAVATSLKRQGWRPCFDRGLSWITPWWSCSPPVARSIRFFEPGKSRSRGQPLFCQPITPPSLGVEMICAEQVNGT